MFSNTEFLIRNSGNLPMRQKVRNKKVSFVIIDNKHLTEHGIRYFCALSKQFVLVTSNKDININSVVIVLSILSLLIQNKQNCSAITCQRCSLILTINYVLTKLKSEYSCERLTIQTGGTLNGLFLREKLIDYIDISGKYLNIIRNSCV